MMSLLNMFSLQAVCQSVRLLASYSEVPQLEVTGLQFLIHQSVWAISLYSYFHALQKYSHSPKFSHLLMLQPRTMYFIGILHKK